MKLINPLSVNEIKFMRWLSALLLFAYWLFFVSHVYGQVAHFSSAETLKALKTFYGLDRVNFYETKDSLPSQQKDTANENS